MLQLPGEGDRGDLYTSFPLVDLIVVPPTATKGSHAMIYTMRVMDRDRTSPLEKFSHEGAPMIVFRINHPTAPDFWMYAVLPGDTCLADEATALAGDFSSRNMRRRREELYKIIDSVTLELTDIEKDVGREEV